VLGDKGVFAAGKTQRDGRGRHPCEHPEDTTGRIHALNVIRYMPAGRIRN
jgi:hypothetical protein